jgi:flagellar hook protein FlgE
MIGALWTGISGLSSQQQALDNESNNIANVNTVGFKSSRISFADQMYQDRIGKGSKILDAEKLYVQGNLKLTGVSYDMALSGEGFFSVANNRTSGTSEILYTRAGNFRMGDNGTLQDAAGNEVQGWMMAPIDSQNDVTTTNPNAHVFTNDYSKLLNSKIVRHNTYVETITAKATDYTQTSKSDSETVFTGAGMKTKSAKISDIESAIADYSNWLQKLKDVPDGASATSISQISQINFKTGTDGLVSKDGDQIYVYIDGNKISQNYVPTTASAETISILDAASFPDTTGWTTDDYDKAASRIETYKALSNKISEIPGLVAYMAKESDTSGVNNDVLQLDENFSMSTNAADMYKGMIQIKSLIPGQEFIISEVAEVSGSSSIQGNFQTQTIAQAGQGVGALESSKDALSRLITGKQQDVYTSSDLGLSTTPQDFTYGITIYDNELGATIPIPNDGATPPNPLNILIDDATTIDDIVTQINNAAAATYNSNTGATTTVLNNMSDYIVAKNVNGNLVIETLDKNYDVEFTGNMKVLAAGTDTAGSALSTSYLPIDKNNNYSGRQGAGAEFIEIVNRVDQTASKGGLQLRLDTLGISDSAFGEFSVDSTGLITMKQDGADFAIGQVAIALFNNNRGLNPVGDNLLSKTNESGEPIYNLNNDKTAKVESQTLELSTADLSESLVNLMVFQRAFEANAKSITTSDELLNTLINLKR